MTHLADPSVVTKAAANNRAGYGAAELLLSQGERNLDSSGAAAVCDSKRFKIFRKDI